MNERKFWISIRKAKDCFFSRRNGYQGKVILGYSCMLRLFGYDLLNRSYNYPDLKESHFFWLRIFNTFKKQ